MAATLNKYPELESDKTSYVEYGKQFTLDDAGIIFESNGIVEKGVIEVASCAWQSRIINNIPEKTRRTEYLKNRFKRQ